MSQIQFFEQLASNNSRLFKEDLLKQNFQDETLKRIFKLTYDPMINFWIRKIPAYTPGCTDRLDIEDAMDDLMLLAHRTYTGHAGIAHLKEILETTYPVYDTKIIEMIIQGDLKCGVSASTINKIWPGLIPEFPVMLASKFDQKLIDKIPSPYYVQKKMDGMRACVVVKDGLVSYFARSGKALELLGELEEDFQQMAKLHDVVYDGEMWVADSSGNPLARKISNGICSKAIKGTISEKEAATINFTLWDRISYERWIKGYECTSLFERMNHLDYDCMSYSGNRIHIVENVECYNMQEIEKVFQNYLAAGEEGVIVKNPNSPWEDKRSKHHVKIKAERSADLLCLAVEEGSGKYEGKIGSLKLTTSDGLIECSCGSGLSDDDRKKDPSEYIGKIVEIKFNEKIQSKGAKKMSLFLPIFVTLRDDKFVANSSEEI